MPKEFEQCRANGGRIRTESLGGNKYRHVCYLDGKRYPGHVKTKKTETKKTETRSHSEQRDLQDVTTFSEAMGLLEDQGTQGAGSCPTASPDNVGSKEALHYGMSFEEIRKANERANELRRVRRQKAGNKIRAIRRDMIAAGYDPRMHPMFSGKDYSVSPEMIGTLSNYLKGVGQPRLAENIGAIIGSVRKQLKPGVTVDDIMPAQSGPKTRQIVKIGVAASKRPRDVQKSAVLDLLGRMSNQSKKSPDAVEEASAARKLGQREKWAKSLSQPSMNKPHLSTSSSEKTETKKPGIISKTSGKASEWASKKGKELIRGSKRLLREAAEQETRMAGATALGGFVEGFWASEQEPEPPVNYFDPRSFFGSIGNKVKTALSKPHLLVRPEKRAFRRMRKRLRKKQRQEINNAKGSESYETVRQKHVKENQFLDDMENQIRGKLQGRAGTADYPALSKEVLGSVRARTDLPNLRDMLPNQEVIQDFFHSGVKDAYLQSALMGAGTGAGIGVLGGTYIGRALERGIDSYGARNQEPLKSYASKGWVLRLTDKTGYRLRDLPIATRIAMEKKFDRPDPGILEVVESPTSQYGPPPTGYRWKTHNLIPRWKAEGLIEPTQTGRGNPEDEFVEELLRKPELEESPGFSNIWGRRDPVPATPRGTVTGRLRDPGIHGRGRYFNLGVPMHQKPSNKRQPQKTGSLISQKDAAASGVSYSESSTFLEALKEVEERDKEADMGEEDRETMSQIRGRPIPSRADIINRVKQRAAAEGLPMEMTMASGALGTPALGTPSAAPPATTGLSGKVREVVGRVSGGVKGAVGAVASPEYLQAASERFKNRVQQEIDEELGMLGLRRPGLHGAHRRGVLSARRYQPGIRPNYYDTAFKNMSNEDLSADIEAMSRRVKRGLRSGKPDIMTAHALDRLKREYVEAGLRGSSVATRRAKIVLDEAEKAGAIDTAAPNIHNEVDPEYRERRNRRRREYYDRIRQSRIH